MPWDSHTPPPSLLLPIIIIIILFLLLLHLLCLILLSPLSVSLSVSLSLSLSMSMHQGKAVEHTVRRWPPARQEKSSCWCLHLWLPASREWENKCLLFKSPSHGILRSHPELTNKLTQPHCYLLAPIELRNPSRKPLHRNKISEATVCFRFFNTDHKVWITCGFRSPKFSSGHSH